MIDKLTSKVRGQFIQEIMEEDAKQLKIDTELREKEVREDREKRHKARQALMPMHRTLPDFVEVNEKRYNYYENPRNEARVVKGLKFMQKIAPSFVSTTANELINAPKELKFRVPEHRLNIFQEDQSGSSPSAQSTQLGLSPVQKSRPYPTLVQSPPVDFELLSTSELIDRADKAVKQPLTVFAPVEKRRKVIN